MALKDIVDVQITRQTAALTRVGFGTLAFVYDTATVPSARVLQFGDADEIETSEDLTADAKVALTAAFQGDLAPDRVKAIYRLVDQDPSSGNETYVQALAAASDVDGDWYCVTIQSRTLGDITAVAAWVEARDKIFITASSESGIIDPLSTIDVASQLLALSYSRTGLIYTADADSTWPDLSWAGGVLPYDPGSVTWAFKKVSGSAGQSFTASQISALEAKRVTRLETIQGITRTFGGYTFDAGAFIDLIQSIDWLKQRMAEDIFIALVNATKIPYTNEGIAIVEEKIRNRLSDAVARNVIADDDNLTVTVPDVADTDPNDRANRILRDVKFTARLAGAIHKVIVRGTATV